jgi:hypothetical protein
MVGNDPGGLRGQKLCVQCVVTTTNQETGQRHKEPLRTLATYRKNDRGIVFGRNFTVSLPDSGEMTISFGDSLDVITRD